MVYPDIEDVFSLEQGSDWSLKYKKDLALTQVIKYVQEGTNPSNEERRNLPVRTNQLLRWFKYLSSSQILQGPELLYLRD